MSDTTAAPAATAASARPPAWARYVGPDRFDEQFVTLPGPLLRRAAKRLTERGDEMCSDDPDARLLQLHRRARLLRMTAEVIGEGVHPTGLAQRLQEEAEAVADEAMMIVAEDGAQHGEAYYHETNGQLTVGWALTDAEIRLRDADRRVGEVRPVGGVL